MKATTSISVNPLTLRWVNAVKSFLEFTMGRSATLDETVLLMASAFDFMAQKGASIGDPKEGIIEWAQRRMGQLVSDFTADDVALFNDMLKHIPRCPSCGWILAFGAFGMACLNKDCPLYRDIGLEAAKGKRTLKRRKDGEVRALGG